MHRLRVLGRFGKDGNFYGGRAKEIRISSRCYPAWFEEPGSLYLLPRRDDTTITKEEQSSQDLAYLQIFPSLSQLRNASRGNEARRIATRKKRSHVTYDAATYIDSGSEPLRSRALPRASGDAIIDPSPLPSPVINDSIRVVPGFHGRAAGTTARRHGRSVVATRFLLFLLLHLLLFVHTDRPLHEESTKRPGRSPVIRLPRGNAPFIHVSLIHQHRRVPAAIYDPSPPPPRDGVCRT